MIATSLGIEVHFNHEPKPTMTPDQAVAYRRISSVATLRERFKASSDKIRALSRWFNNKAIEDEIGHDCASAYLKKLNEVLYPIISTDSYFAKNLLTLLEEWIENRHDAVDGKLMDEITKLIPNVVMETYSDNSQQGHNCEKTMKDSETERLMGQRVELMELITEYNVKALAKGIPTINFDSASDSEDTDWEE